MPKPARCDAADECRRRRIYALRLAADARDLRAAQRLRYRVFVEELGGTGPLVDHAARLERDDFDPLFDHLLLIDPRRDAAALEDVVGVYRLLPVGPAWRRRGGSTPRANTI